MSMRIINNLQKQTLRFDREIPASPPPVIERLLPKADIPDDFEKFNKLIGLPLHPATYQPIGLMPYQTNFHKKIPRDHQRKFHINKSRQMGFSETILRVIAYEAFHKYQGGQILIIAGTRQKTANKLMKRLRPMFDPIGNTVKGWSPGKRVMDIGAMELLELKNGTSIQALPSSIGSIRGDTKIKAVLIDEAAWFDLEDDSIVMDAVGPIIFTNQSDLFILSTPNGRRGFFYDLSKDPQDYMPLTYSYEHGLGFIYTQEQMDKELARTDIDVQQEYMNQFTTTRRSYYGDEFTEGTHEAEDYGEMQIL